VNHEKAIKDIYPALNAAEIQIAVAVLKEIDWGLEDYKSIAIAVSEATQGQRYASDVCPHEQQALKNTDDFLKDKAKKQKSFNVWLLRLLGR
tara:strand:+ start:141 stop:416 length:276 start_codon:yes stop_codon:yes gene_type:complete